MKSIEKPVAKPSYEELEKTLLEALERIKQLEAIIAGMQKKSDLNSQTRVNHPAVTRLGNPEANAKRVNAVQVVKKDILVKH